ncbi:putative signal transducing protein [Blastopirellula marina]|uniref:DUF2007 domain-containing protein n=1 Tax=Blastopirellula marina TaxID=124 RepID=A0A2S8GMV0_9BACT|nr:DUF2007 domain-containing protein [Blastopirellula marina]PQO45748.1 hypothetical protein C5Y93_12535 [Blastopirellula marina]
MDFQKPVIVYTAATNLEAHLIVEMLLTSGISAHTVEDQSGVSLWAFGTISQFHKPNIWVDESTAQQAADLIRDFEEQRKARNTPVDGAGEIQVSCEDCGKTTSFPSSLDGTTQVCQHCGAYVDVGELGWDEDFGEPED